MSQSQNKTQHKSWLYKKARINVSKLMRGFNVGTYSSLFQSQGIEYAESRLYNYGDDARYIDWKLSGRMNTLHTKYFHEERNRAIWLIFDCSGSMNIGAPVSVYDLAIEVATTLMMLSFLHKDKVGVVIFDSEVRFFISPTLLPSVLQRSYHNFENYRFSHNKGDIENVIQFSKKVLKQRSLVIFVSDFLYEGSLESLISLSLAHNLFAVRVFYNLRDQLPGSVALNAIDAETQESSFLFTDSIKKQYIESQQKVQRKWQSINYQRNRAYVEISTTDSVFYVLAKFFQRKK